MRVDQIPSPTSFAICLAMAGSASAQTTAGFRIRLVDHSGRPVPGALVLVESLERGERRSLRTDARGVASASGLLPGAYRVQGQAFRLKADERAELTLRAGEAAATVSVESSPLRTETSSVGIQTGFEAADLERLPLAPHRYVEHASLVPGVSPSGKPEPVVLGSMLDGNSFLVDGMPTNLGSTGRFGMNLSTEILESQTLTTGGHKAEVAFASGAVFGLVTKSGDNQFRGALFGSRIWRGLNSRPDAGKANQPDERATDATEWGFSASGPLLKDRLFFFGAFNRQLTSLDFENIQPIGTLPHRRSLSEDRSYRFLKLTWLATPTQRVEASWFGDPVLQENFDGASNRAVKDFQMGDRTRGGDSYLLKHVGAFGHAVTWENTLGLHRTRFFWSPANPEAGPNRAQLDAPGRESFGAYETDRLERIENLSLRSEATVILGEHQLKGGFQGLRSSFTQAFKRPSGGLSFLDRSGGGAGPSGGDLTQIRNGLLAQYGTDFGYGAGDSLLTPSPVTGQLQGGRPSYLYQRTLSDLAEYGSPLKQVTLGFFAQDDWRWNGYLTVNLGLRLDRVRVDGEDGRELYRQTLFSPRLGLSLDPSADGRNRIFVYFGRIYSPPTPGALSAGGATTGGPALTRQVWIPALADWRTWQLAGVQGVKNVAVDPGLQASRTDLAQVGAERLQGFGPMGIWTLEAVLTRKRVRDLIDTYNPAFGYLPELNAQANASAGKRLVANLPGLKREFQGVDLVLHRRFDGGHRVQFSYSYGDLRGNSEVGSVAALSGKDTGFAAIPSLREDYRQSRYEGPLNEQVRHSLKSFGHLALPHQFELSWAYILRSGLRYSRLVTLSGDNVLAAGASRGDQQLPRVASLDLSLAFRRKGGPVSWRLAVECFNSGNQQPLVAVSNIDGGINPANHQQPRVWQLSARASF